MNTTVLFCAAVQKVKISFMKSNIRNGYELSEEEDSCGLVFDLRMSQMLESSYSKREAIEVGSNIS